MTAVRLALSAPTSDGTGRRPVGSLEWRPSRRRDLAGDVILPAPFTVGVGADTPPVIDVAPTEPGWAWQVVERVQGGAPRSRYLTVPNSVSLINYADLVEVDPATLDPVTLSSAWWTQVTAYAQPLGDYATYAQAPTGVSATDTANLQAAFDAVPAVGGVVYLPPGNYVVDGGGLHIDHQTKVVGAGAANHQLGAGTKISCASTTAHLLTVNADGCSFEGFALVNTASSDPTAGSGLYFTRGNFSHIDRISIHGFYDNLRYDQGFYYTITDSVFLDPVHYGMWLRNTAAGEFDHGDQVIHGCVITGFNKSGRNGASAVRWESGGGLRFSLNKINGTGQPGNPGVGMFVNGLDLVVADGGNTVDLMCTGNSIENVSGCLLRVGQAGPANTGSFSWMTITGNEFFNAPFGVGIVGNVPGKIADAVISDNSFNWVQSPILAENVDGFAVGLNRHRGCGANDPNRPIVNLGQGVFDASVDRQNVQGDSILLFHDYEAENNTNSSAPSQTGTHVLTREIPATTSTTDYTTLWRVRLGFYSAAVLELNIGGVISNVGAHCRTLRRLVNREDTFPLLTTVGADTSAGSNYDLLLDTSLGDGWIAIKLRLNSVVGGTGLHGRATLKLDGQVAQIAKGP